MSKPSTPKNFESALGDLENLVARMENGQLPLEESLAAYKHGVELLNYCQKTLQQTEQQIRILSEKNTLQVYTDD